MKFLNKERLLWATAVATTLVVSSASASYVPGIISWMNSGTPVQVTTSNPLPTADASSEGSLSTLVTNTGGLSQGGTTTGQKGALIMGAVKSVQPSWSDGTTQPLNLDASGNLRVNLAAGGGVGQSSATLNETGSLVMGAVTSSAPSYTNGNTNPLSMDTAGNLRIVCVTGCAGGNGGTSAVDESAFTYGTTNVTPFAGVYNSNPTNLTSGQAGAVALSPDRKLVTSPYASQANQVSGTASATDTTSTQIIAAPGIGQFINVTAIQCTNGGNAGALVTIQSGLSGTTIWQGYTAAAGGGFSVSFQTPLRLPTGATGLYFADAQSTTMFCNAQGFIGQ